jgi:hypothetical protein
MNWRVESADRDNRDAGGDWVLWAMIDTTALPLCSGTRVRRHEWPDAVGTDLSGERLTGAPTLRRLF